MFRSLTLATGLYSAHCDQDGIFDDDANLHLLQLKAGSRHDSMNNHTGTHSWWRNGGCAADLSDPAICAFNTDTHMTHKFNSEKQGSHEMNRRGAQPLARTKDDSFTMDAFQCQFRREASMCGVAMKMGDHKIECSALPPDCHTYLYCTLDGEALTFDTFPKRLPSGLLITHSSSQVYCFDSPDGRSSVTIRSSYMWAYNHGNVAPNCKAASVDWLSAGRNEGSGSFSWLDGQVRVEKEIAVVDDDSLCGGPGSLGMSLADSLFSTTMSSMLCDRSNADQTPECENMPDPPPPLTPAASCEEHGCSYEAAQHVCSPLVEHDVKYNDCLTDVCGGCGVTDDKDRDMAEIGALDIAEEELDEPGPACVNAAGDCNHPETCQKSVKVSLDTITQNNLAGVGPDSGAEEIRFSKAALVDGTVIDLVLKAVGGNYKGKASANGKKGSFGVTNLKSDSDVELEFSFLNSDTQVPVVLDSVALSFYDLDEGKKGKSRTTLTSCEATNAVLTTNTELFVQQTGGCYAISSGAHGTKLNNPTAPDSLTQEQGARSVSFVYKSVSSVKVTMAMGKGYGWRNTFWSFEPSLSCLAGESGAGGDASDVGLPPLTEPVDMSVPSERTCPDFQFHGQCGVQSGRTFGGTQNFGSDRLGNCYDRCANQKNPAWNAISFQQITGIMYAGGPGCNSADSIANAAGCAIPTGRDSQTNGKCWCVTDCSESYGVDDGLWYTIICPPWKPWCNMAIWEACLVQKGETKQADGTPWNWQVNIA